LFPRFSGLFVCGYSNDFNFVEINKSNFKRNSAKMAEYTIMP